MMNDERTEAMESVWEEKIASLGKTIDRLTAATDRLALVTERVSVLEEKHQTQNSTVGRAFDEIKKIQTAMADHEDEARVVVEKHCTQNDRDHKDFSRYIWLATGFCMACVVFWSLFGIRLNNMVDKQMEAIQSIQLHITEDKVRTPEDVRAIHKQLEREAK